MLSARSTPASCSQTYLSSLSAAAAIEVAVHPLCSTFSCCAEWRQWAAPSAEGAEGGAGGAATCVDDAPSGALHEGASSRALLSGNHWMQGPTMRQLHPAAQPSLSLAAHLPLTCPAPCAAAGSLRWRGVAQVYQELCKKHATFRERSENTDLAVHNLPPLPAASALKSPA